MVGNLPVAVVVLVLTVLRSTVAETVAEGPSSGLPSARRFDEAAVEDPIVKAQLELLKRGKINKRRLIVRLKDNPTDKAAGPSGFFDPFPDETPGGMARTNEVVVLSSEGPSSMTTTRMYSGPGFRAQSSITVKTRAFKEVERVRKKGKDNMEGFLDKKNFTDMKHYWYGARSGVSVLEVEDESMLEELWAKLSEDGGVEFVEPDMELTAFQSRRGCEPISDWGFHQTRTPQALALLGSNIAAELEDEQVLVAVIDSGVDFNHPALRDRVFVNEAELNGRDGVDDDQNGFIDDIRGWNFHDNNNDTMDFNGHGSHVAGIIAAAPNANPEFQGIAPNVKILPCKFTGKDRTGSVSDAVRCFEYAWLMGAELTSNSWGAPMAISRSLSVALDNAEQAGVLAVFAAGNDGANNDGDFLERTFPASLDHDIIISVAAINEEGNLLELSNFGDENVDIGAPGASILSTGRNGEYVRMSGTSMATPFVTGAAALLLGACKKEGMSCSPADIKSAILRGVVTTEDLRRRVSSSGHLDVSNAVQRLGLGLNVSQASSPDVIPLTQCGSAPFLSSPYYLVGVVASMLLVLLLWL